MRNIVFASRKPYVIGYRYYAKGGFIWNGFNDLNEVNSTFKGVIKNSVQFRIFKYDSLNDKYNTCFSKQRLYTLTLKKKLTEVSSSKTLFIMNGIKEFTNKLEEYLDQKKNH